MDGAILVVAGTDGPMPQTNDDDDWEQYEYKKKKKVFVG